MNRAVIFLNGDLSDPKSILKLITKDTLILCADGGILHALKLNLTPHAVLGDYDSTPSVVKKKLAKSPINWIPHPPEKNQQETDSELVIRYALEQNVKEIFIFGFIGDRLDHMIATLMHVVSLPNSHSSIITIFGGNQECTLVSDLGEKRIQGNTGDNISLIPIVSVVNGISTTGLQYTLTNATLPFGSTRGVSNVMTRNLAEVRIKEGILLIVHTISKA